MIPCLPLMVFFIHGIVHTGKCCGPKFGAVWLSTEGNVRTGLGWPGETLNENGQDTKAILESIYNFVIQHWSLVLSSQLSGDGALSPIGINIWTEGWNTRPRGWISSSWLQLPRSGMKEEQKSRQTEGNVPRKPSAAI